MHGFCGPVDSSMCCSNFDTADERRFWHIGDPVDLYRSDVWPPGTKASALTLQRYLRA